MATTSLSLEQELKKNNLSVTKTRKQVFNALADSDALSMNQLIRKLARKMNRTTVYRNVELFEKLGIVNRLQIGWKYKLELSEAFAEHHHHATCVQCEQIFAFEESSELVEGINNLAHQLSFNLTSHNLELRGVCESCKIHRSNIRN